MPKVDTEPCRHCGEQIYRGSYAQRQGGPLVPDDDLVAGVQEWRHYANGLTSCADSILVLAEPVE